MALHFPSLIRRIVITAIAIAGGMLGAALLTSTIRPDTPKLSISTTATVPNSAAVGPNRTLAEPASQSVPTYTRSSELGDATKSVSAETAANLFDHIVKAGNSTDLTVLTDGWWAYTVCASVAAKREELTLLSAQVVQNQAQQKSAALLLSRCRTFLENDRSAQLSLRLRIRDQVQASGAYVLGLSTGTLTNQQFEQLLLRQDWLSYQQTLNITIDKYLVSRGMTREHPTAHLVYAALQVVPCLIGRECGPSSIGYAFECVTYAHCGQSQADAPLQGMSDDERARTLILAHEMAAAFAKRDAKYFGYR